MSDIYVIIEDEDPVKLVDSVEKGDTGPTGPVGPKGPAGSDANVTNANVNAAISTNSWATRTALGLGNAALATTSTGGNGTADSGKVATFNSVGGISFGDTTAHVGNAVSAFSFSGNAVVATSISGYGGQFFSTSGVALTANSGSANAADIYSATGTGAAIYSEGNAVGCYCHSEGGPGLFAYSGDGTGAISVSYAATYHHEFGDPVSLDTDNRSFVARVLGAFGWFRGAYTSRIQAASTLTADRIWTVPDLVDSNFVGDVATQTLTNKTLTNPSVTNYTESVVSIGTVTTSHTLALTNGTRQRVRLTASTACTFTMPTATDGKSFVLEVEQAATTGLGTAIFTGVDWGAAGAPTITPTAGKMDIVTFMSNGTKWFGAYNQGFTY